MDPETNRYILMNESKGLVPGYPQSMLDTLGKSNIAAVHGSTHRHIRAALLSLLCPSIIRWHFCRRLTKLQVLNGSQCLGNSCLNSLSWCWEPFLCLSTFPEQITTAVSKQENIVSMLRRLVEERRACQETKHDMLGLLMNGGEENRYNLTDEEKIDQMIAILYSGYETVSTTSMMAVKYLHDHPNVLQELRKEHLAIRERKRAEDPINWNDFKSMNFTGDL